MMNYSKKIINYSTNQHYSAEANDNRWEKVGFDLSKLSCRIDVFYELQTIDDEVCINQAKYNTELTGPYLGVLEGYFQFIQGKPLEVLDRISPKELDYYLRDSNSIPSLEYYSQEFYEVLSVGEGIINKELKLNKNQPLFDREINEAFENISYSEQVEFFEEFCSKHIYNNVKFGDVRFDLQDIENNTFSIISSNPVSLEQAAEVTDKFNSEFFTQYKFNFN